VQLFRADPNAVRRRRPIPSPLPRVVLLRSVCPILPNLFVRVSADPLRDEVPALRGEARAQGHRRPRGTTLSKLYLLRLDLRVCSLVRNTDDG
jgi:hypothetical protein